MLVLSRKTSERIFIDVNGERVVVTLIDSHSGKARLGFEAPNHIRIVREELDREAA